jgi:hypothetical protein
VRLTANNRRTDLKRREVHLKAALAVILSMALVTEPVPVGAQEGTNAVQWARAGLGTSEAAGPISRPAALTVARWITSEGKWQGTAQGQSKVNSEKVRKTRQGDRITFTARDGTNVAGWFIRADEQSLVVLVPEPGLKRSEENLVAEFSRADVWDHAEEAWSNIFRTRAA